MVDVLAVGSGVGEALEAFWALEGLLAGVEPAVLGEVVLVLEGLVAVGALVRPLIWNYSEMRLVGPHVSTPQESAGEISYIIT